MASEGLLTVAWALTLAGKRTMDRSAVNQVNAREFPWRSQDPGIRYRPMGAFRVIPRGILKRILCKFGPPWPHGALEERLSLMFTHLIAVSDDGTYPVEFLTKFCSRLVV